MGTAKNRQVEDTGVNVFNNFSGILTDLRKIAFPSTKVKIFLFFKMQMQPLMIKNTITLVVMNGKK